MFTSGAKELGENGWWRLTEMKPPYIKHGKIVIDTQYHVTSPDSQHINVLCI